MEFNIEYKNKSFFVDVDTTNKTLVFNKKSSFYECTKHNGRFFLRYGTKLYRIDNVKVEESNVEFSINGFWYKTIVKDEQHLVLDKLGFKSKSSNKEGYLTSPMPGKIIDLVVQQGDQVFKDQPVAILEAMKMENELKSPIDGIIKKIDVKIGQSVEKKTLILEIEALG